MIRMLAALALLAVSASAAPALAQEAGLAGRWRTSAENGVVSIERCGEVYCGRLKDAAPLRADPDQRDVRNRNAELRTRRLKDLTVLTNFSGGPRSWSGGPLYDPETGQGASTGTLTLLDDDTLAVKGCIAPLLCRTQTWKRVR
ncbi:DUF2147 domain-containing protein [Caulobacter flavus]|uniref:DUF2147 domain-containing protein n=1 Tax=Caulobacter flavus TaxID=1679497 RepID=A0A2N5CU47_9CAUL|nr:DUF2147 domain-containing protein [Caulobacter flavus]AYV48024.1 DUF2147 domain-containing protein [Caulobacter flavus]PLR16288.1 DUF2147 domain-containing protein [Caulobacter flavus]